MVHIELIWRLKESMVLQMNGRNQHQSYLPKAQKTLTFARVFTNIEPANAYQNLFKDLFCCVEKDISETFNFFTTFMKRDWDVLLQNNIKDKL